MSDDPITRNWPAWVTDLDDLIKRAERQHSDMRCCCSVDDDCYIGLLLDEVERLRARTEADKAVLDAADEYARERDDVMRGVPWAVQRLLLAERDLLDAAVAARRAVQEAPK